MKTKYFELNTKKLNFAVLTKKYDTFDTIQKKVGTSNKLSLDQLIFHQLNPKLKTKTSRNGTLVK
jgi:hypothetical protein